ncbi:MAG: hypothetical protein GXZ04_02930 [Clostridiales bacterium]|nr:hypothetical protein [Clostridiales bacterium]
MKKLAILLLTCLILVQCVPTLAAIERHQALDAAFSMLEEGNIFLTRYNELTGAEIQPMYKYGLPYFFGGKNTDYLMNIKKPLETTRYYSPKRSYVYGFDCSGYTQWINQQIGKPKHDKLSSMILKYSLYKNNHLPIKELPSQEWHEHLVIGDFLVAKTRARHIMMYMGTLADYGFTAENAPELAQYLNHPLVIHDGPNFFYPERYEKYIEENGLKNVTTTNGGVMISIVGVPATAFPLTTESNRETYHYFELEGYPLTLYDLDAATSYVWFRM